MCIESRFCNICFLQTSKKIICISVMFSAVRRAQTALETGQCTVSTKPVWSGSLNGPSLGQGSLQGQHPEGNDCSHFPIVSAGHGNGPSLNNELKEVAGSEETSNPRILHPSYDTKLNLLPFALQMGLPKKSSGLSMFQIHFNIVSPSGKNSSVEGRQRNSDYQSGRLWAISASGVNSSVCVNMYFGICHLVY